MTWAQRMPLRHQGLLQLLQGVPSRLWHVMEECLLQVPKLGHLQHLSGQEGKAMQIFNNQTLHLLGRLRVCPLTCQPGTRWPGCMQAARVQRPCRNLWVQHKLIRL